MLLTVIIHELLGDLVRSLVNKVPLAVGIVFSLIDEAIVVVHALIARLLTVRIALGADHLAMVIENHPVAMSGHVPVFSNRHCSIHIDCSHDSIHLVVDVLDLLDVLALMHGHRQTFFDRGSNSGADVLLDLGSLPDHFDSATQLVPRHHFEVVLRIEEASVDA